MKRAEMEVEVSVALEVQGSAWNLAACPAFSALKNSRAVLAQ